MQAGQVGGGGVVRVETQNSLEAVAVIQGRGGEAKASDRVRAVGVEEEWQLQRHWEEMAEVIRPGINQMLSSMGQRGL